MCKPTLRTLSEWRIHFLSPGLRHIVQAACAVDIQHVSLAGLRGAHRQEVRTGAADGELRQIGQGLADRRAKQEGADHLVERGQVLVERGV